MRNHLFGKPKYVYQDVFVPMDSEPAPQTIVRPLDPLHPEIIPRPNRGGHGYRGSLADMYGMY